MADIDMLAPLKSHIDMANKTLPSDFGLEDYVLSKILDDVILVEYADLIAGEDDAEFIERNGLVIPTAQVTNAWRKGRVILTGSKVKECEVNDIVVFPNNMGIPITNLEVEGHGKLKNGLFINEVRLFGICKVKDEEN